MKRIAKGPTAGASTGKVGLGEAAAIALKTGYAICGRDCPCRPVLPRNFNPGRSLRGRFNVSETCRSGILCPPDSSATKWVGSRYRPLPFQGSEEPPLRGVFSPSILPPSPVISGEAAQRPPQFNDRPSALLDVDVANHVVVVLQQGLSILSLLRLHQHE